MVGFKDIRLGFLVGTLAVSLSAAFDIVGRAVEVLEEAFWVVGVRGVRELIGDLVAFVGDGFELALLARASLLREMLDGL